MEEVTLPIGGGIKTVLVLNGVIPEYISEGCTGVIPLVFSCAWVLA